MLGAGAPDQSARFGRIGHNMMCTCGCSQILLECNHVGCPVSGPMIGELHEQLDGPNGGGADSLILNWFVAKYGATVLAAPLRGGFDLVAWIVPLTVFLFAIFGTGWMVRHWATRRQTAVAGAAPPTMVDSSVRDRIRRDTEYL
jgi:cytochrome c-type biogenesis protein CcmH